MNYTAVTIPAAEKDIEDAFDYYYSVSPDVAKQFLFRLVEAKEYILKNPFAFENRYRDVHTLLLRQFPYLVHYIVSDEKKK